MEHSSLDRILEMLPSVVGEAGKAREETAPLPQPGLESTTPGTDPDTSTSTPGPETETMPGTGTYMPGLDTMPEDVLEQTGRHKRKRRGCPRSGRRRVINCSEGQYYVEDDYYPTWRCFPHNLNVQ